jgi:predicted metal-dependent HD superfamily phosphohydrolase
MIDFLRDETEHLPLVQFVGWFHDAIYDTDASDNEERSAVLAESTCTTWQLPAEDIALVGRMIRATRTHQPEESAGLVLLDADLSILGADESLYDAYASAIRREYAWVLEEEYRRGRTRILQGFLERERIFRLERMRQLFEAQARVNLAREIELLGRV